jgi:uncharacterized protein (TIGR00369 family)
MSLSPETLQSFAAAMNNGSPQAQALGIETVGFEKDAAILKIAYRPELVGDPDTGVIAGGVVTTLMDHSCGQAVFAALGEPGTIATLDLRIDYMRAAEPGKALFCRAHCYKLTRSVAFVRASAYDDQVDDPVATAQAAFMLDSSAGRGPGANLRPPAAPRTDHKS